MCINLNVWLNILWLGTNSVNAERCTSVNYWIRVKPSSDVFGKIKQFGLIVTKLVKG